MSWPKRTRSLVAIGVALERLACLHPVAIAGARSTRPAGVADHFHPEAKLDRGGANNADLKRGHACRRF